MEVLSVSAMKNTALISMYGYDNDKKKMFISVQPDPSDRKCTFVGTQRANAV